MRTKLAVDLKINSFSGPNIVDYDSGITNGMVSKKSNGQLYVTQRPSIDVEQDASDTVVDTQGRGIYYWPLANSLYFVNNDTIYKGAYATVIGTITAGAVRGEFFELDTLLVFVDYSNDEAWTITTSGTLTKITDVDFPPNATAPVSLAGGGAVLDGFLFVLGVDGAIYNSNFENASAWTALDYVSAERDPDAGAHLSKHHDNLAVFGTSSLEFFYIPSSPPATGSPLYRREDIYHKLGCADSDSVWTHNDSIFLIGADEDGSLGVYVINSFVPNKISSDSIDSMLVSSLNSGQYDVTGSGFSAHGHIFYILTFYATGTTLAPQATYVYDATLGIWGDWETTILGHVDFPLVQWTKKMTSNIQRGEGIMSNGDIITSLDAINPQDSTGGSGGYVATGYVADGFVTSGVYAGTAFPMKIRIGQQDFGAGEDKSIGRARIISDKTTASQTLTMSWSDGDNSAFSNSFNFDLSSDYIADSMGQFKRRNFQFSVTSDEQVRLEAMDFSIRRGSP